MFLLLRLSYTVKIRPVFLASAFSGEGTVGANI